MFQKLKISEGAVCSTKKHLLSYKLLLKCFLFPAPCFFDIRIVAFLYFFSPHIKIILKINANVTENMRVPANTIAK